MYTDVKTLGFSRKGFHVNLVFFFIVPSIIQVVLKPLGIFDLINGNHEIRNSFVGSQYRILVVAS